MDKKCLKELVDSLPGHVYWKDKNGVYLGCNKQMLEFLGFQSDQEIIGKTDYELAWKEYADLYSKNDKEAIRTGRVVCAEEGVVGPNGLRKDFLANKVPLKNGKNEIIGVLGISLDITQKKQAEEYAKIIKERAEVTSNIIAKMAEEIIGTKISYRKSSEEYVKLIRDYFENMIALMPGHIYWMDRNGRFLGCNNQQAIDGGLSNRHEIVGKRNSEMPWKDEASYLDEANEKVMSTGYALEFDEPSTLANGKKAMFLSHKTPLRDENGNVIGLLGVSLDVTERDEALAAMKHAKEKAEMANKAKTEFLSNMRHDIRTPLTGIVGFADLIKDEADSEKIKGYADNLIAAGGALLDFLGGILESIKVTMGEVPILRKKFDLKKQLVDIINLYSAKAKEKRLDFLLEYDDHIPHYLIGDYIRVHRLILELVANALNFTHKGFVKISAVLIRQEEQKSVIKIIVQDTGIGISEDKQQDIFVQFKRLTPSYQGIYKGAGLGLTIVKQFINDLQGEIHVKSELDEGTTFTCVLPLYAALLDDDENVAEVPKIMSHNTMQSLIKGSSIESVFKGKMPSHRILLVEDHPLVSEAEERLLVKLGNRVDVASTGKEAIELFKQHAYNLVFMDIGLPDTDGYQVAREIRALEGNRNGAVPIIALSAHTDVEYSKTCIESGMSGVLSKPLKKNQAIEILGTFIPSSKIKEEKKKEKVSKKAKEETLLKIEGKVFDVEYMKNELEYSDKAVKKFPKLLIKSLPEDISELTEAYQKEDWETVQQMAHKVKGGAMYGGAVRLKEACSRLEKYLYDGNSELAPDLYKLVLKEVEAVNNYNLEDIEG